MLHLGHFSFDEVDQENNIRHGYVTCVVNADNEELDAEKFKNHLLEMKLNNSVFGTIVNIHIEDIIQVETIPEKPIITRLQSSKGEFPKSVSYSLPSVELPGIEAFGFTPNVEKHENGEDTEYKDSEPFLIFH